MNKSIPWSTFLIIVSVTVFFRQPIRANEHYPNVTLDWTSFGDDPTCIDKPEIIRRVEYVLARKIFDGTDNIGIVVKGSIEPLESGSGWTCRIQVRNNVGSTPEYGIRELSSRSGKCGDLSDAVVLVIALLVDDAGLVKSTLNIPLGNSNPTEENSPTALGEEGQIQQKEQAWSAFLGGESTASYKILPGLGVGVGMRMEAAYASMWPVALSFAGWLRSDKKEYDSGGSFSGWTASLSACPSLLSGRKAVLSLCAGASAGTLHVSGIGLYGSESHIRPYCQIEALFAARLTIVDPLWIRLGIGLGVPLIRDRYTYEREEQGEVLVHQAGPIVPLASIGIGLSITNEKK